MTKKISAIKATKIAESSSSKAIDAKNDPTRFWRMGFIAERGFNTDRAPDAFTAAVTTLGWGNFIKHRGDYIVPVVREFYRGIPDPKEGKPQTYSVVRGEVVDFSPSAINEFFKLGYHGKALENKVATWGREEMEEVRKRICVEESTWEKFGSEFKLKKPFLSDEATTWFTFIRHSLMPTSHTTFVEKERLIILDAIMEGGKIDVGKMIAKEIEKARIKSEGNLYFPCLITELCKLADVEIEAREERRSPTGAIPAIFKPRQRPGVIAGDAITLNRLKQNQQALCKFVKAQFEWEKAMMEKLSRGKEIVEPPVFPEWLIEEEGVREAMPQEEGIVEGADVGGQRKRKRTKTVVVKKGRSPAKKKKKVSSEETLNTEDLDSISEDDEEETRRLMREEVRGSESEDDSIRAESGEEAPEKKNSDDEFLENLIVDPEPTPTKPPSPTKVPTPSPQAQVIPETPQTQTQAPSLQQQPVTKPTTTSPHPSPTPAPIPSKTQPPSPSVTKEPTPEIPPQQEPQPASDVASVIAPSVITPTEQLPQSTPVATPNKSPRIKKRAHKNPKAKASVIAGNEEEESIQAEVQKSPSVKLTAIEEEPAKEDATKEDPPVVPEASEQEKEAANKLVEMLATKAAEQASASVIAVDAITPEKAKKEKKKGKAEKPVQPSRVSARTRSGVPKK